METSGALPVGTILLGLFGGLALFLFGMEQMTEAMKSISGPRMKNLLGQMTTNRFKAATAGAFITAVIQSSSVTTVLVVGFITAGLMALTQAIGVIMGANIGTTITAQIVAFKVTKFSLVLIIVGFGILFMSKRQRNKNIGLLLMGLGLIFFGMDMMSEATKPLRTYEPFILLMQSMTSPLPAIIVAALFTALVQSSSATTGVVIVLASQGFITLDTGIALIFGANIGTCVTALLAAIGKPRAAVQAAVVHVLFNVLGVVLWFFFIDQLAALTVAISPSSDELTGVAKLAADTPRQIANAHTIFNVANTFIFIWFVTPMAWIVQRIVPERPAEVSTVMQPKYLDPNLLDTPELALDRVRLEIGRMGVRALEMLWKALPVVMSGDEEQLEELAEMDHDVDSLQSAIIYYLGQLSQGNLRAPQTEMLHDYMAVATYIENIGDMVETNLVDAGRERILRDVTISPGTQEAITAMHAKICWSVEQALEAVDRDDKELALEVIAAKSEINRLTDEIDNHLTERLVADEENRLNAYRIETDIVENFRRMYYFAKRIAKAIVESDTLPEALTDESGTEPVREYALEMEMAEKVDEQL